MRVGLISDVHGNLLALQAVLTDLERHGCDTVVCLGDVVEHGPYPHECLEMVTRLGGPCVMGNTDERMLKPVLQASGEQSARQQKENWSRAQLTAADRTLISGFRATVTLELRPGLHLLGYHGSPASNTAKVTADLSSEMLDGCFAGYPAGIFAGGHTHQAFCVTYRDGLVVNPGSVGVPYRRPIRPPVAEYAVLEVAAKRISVTLQQVAIDLGALEDSVSASSMPFQNDWLAEWGIARSRATPFNPYRSSRGGFLERDAKTTRQKP